MIGARTKRGLLIALIAIISFVILVIIFISPFAKYFVQKYDEKYLGRKVTVGWIYLNPFSGSIHLKNLRIYEKEGERIFFSVKDFGVNISMLKLPGKTYEIQRISMNSPVAWIIRDKKKTNFDDLLQRFASKDTTPGSKSPTRFSIRNVKIKNGEFHYWENSIPVKYYIRNVNLESEGKKWNADTVNAKFSFQAGPSTGDVKGEFTLNTKNLRYKLHVIVDKYDLKFIEQYLHDMSNYGTFAGNLDARLNMTGNFKNKRDVHARGSLAINDFHFGKSKTKDYISFKTLVVSIRKMEPEGHVYEFDSVILTRPYMKYERYDYLDNVQRMFGKKAQNVKKAAAEKEEKFNLIIEVADYVKLLSKNFFKSYYKINKVAIYQGNFAFYDYSLSEKFAIAANPFTFIADSIDKNKDRVKVKVNTSLIPYGNFSMVVGINPKDSSDFDLNYELKNLNITIFNPYLITYTSYPLDRGVVEFNGKWNVRKGKIRSENHMLINDPHLTRNMSRKDEKKLPLPLILSFVRERDNMVDYQIPIKGDLNDPNFKIVDVLLDVLTNIFIKPVSLPYIVKVDHVNNEIEKYLAIKWRPRKIGLSENQERFIKKINDFLKDNPEASLTITPVNYEDREKEYILFYEAKKKFYIETHKIDPKNFSKDDSIEVDKLPVKDSQFMHYLNRRSDTTSIFTVQEKCRRILGTRRGLDSVQVLRASSSLVKARYNTLLNSRKVKFKSYFDDSEIADRLHFQKGQNEVPFDGFSFYKITYKGDIPKELMEAYEKMNELKDESPVKRYFYNLLHKG